MSVDALSDAEIRTKLAEYGYPVGPVTQTTRKILVKKLKNLIETRGGTGSRHSLAARYSSDETDEDASSTVVKKKKSSASARRQTLANPMPPPASVALPSDLLGSSRKSPVKEKNLAGNSDLRSIRASPVKDKGFIQSSNFSAGSEYDHAPTPYPNRTVSKSIHKKFTKTHTSMGSLDGLETGSDSDIPDDTNKSYTSSKYSADVGRSYDSKMQNHNTNDDEHIFKTYESKSSALHIVKDNKYMDPPFKPNISSGLSSKEDATGRDSANSSDILDKYETPFLSEFTRRLSAQTSLTLPSLSRSTMKPSGLRQSSVLPEVKEKDSNGHFSSLRSLYSMSTANSRNVSSNVDRRKETATRTFKSSLRTTEESRNNQNIISMVLLVVLALFFVVLAIIYMGLGGKTETIPSHSSDFNVPQCSSGEVDRTKPAVNCVWKDDVESVLRLFKRLHPILMQKAVSVACDDSNETPYLSDADIIEMFKYENMSEIRIKEILHSAQLLIIKNAKWGISLIDISNDNELSSRLLNSMDAVFSARVNENVGMVILDPELPMKCYIKNKLLALLSTFIVVAIALVAAVSTHRLVLWYIRYKKSTEREVFQLVSDIINMVETHHQNVTSVNSSAGQESFLAINHVRDNLIPPKYRKKMAGVWEKAVKFLDENESRIRREVQQVAGEEFHVWRWLPNNTLNTSNTLSPVANKKSKVWQGQAFETMEGSVNSLTCSPTSCLKIRHMFDPDIEIGDGWEIKVQDAILEKCGEDVKILHIRVDRGSREGCVYMKCISQEDAGKAYRALHGCWFDGNLVTVKYLRLERYHERFPDAVCCTTPLKPSNNQRLSMQAHYWQSPQEAN